MNTFDTFRCWELDHFALGTGDFGLVQDQLIFQNICFVVSHEAITKTGATISFPTLP